ncbi:MAG: PIN domain nuclease [Spirochaetes bacterium]|nr:MAG: PIN domain nuclease [Spirochaetota bacterium]
MEIKAGDLLFIDTNIFLTATDQSRQCHHSALNFFKTALNTGFHLSISGQIIREYLVVATRPTEINGLGLNVEEAIANIEEFKRRVIVLEETEEVCERLIGLVRDYDIRGNRIHDANVIATMKSHNVEILVTENVADFVVFPEIKAVNLEAIVPQSKK